MANENLLQNQEVEDFDFEAMEDLLSQQIEYQISDLEIIKEQHEKIGTSENLVNAVIDAAVEGFNNNMAQQFGEDFIRENGGMTLDLSKAAHIQNTENFDKGKIATHNTNINYQERYDNWQNNFSKKDNGSVRKHGEKEYRNGKEITIGKSDKYHAGKAVVKSQVRDEDFSSKNLGGSKTVHKDHIIPAAEIMRDPEAYAHLDKSKITDFAKSKKNIQDLDANANQSKGDLSNSDWHEREREKGKSVAERFNVDDKQLNENDESAREEYSKIKKEGVIESEKKGKASRIAEGKRVLKGVGMSVLISLMSGFVKEIIKVLIHWLREKGRKLSTFMDEIKSALSNFMMNLKDNLFQSAKSAVITLLTTTIFGELTNMINKAVTFLKQSWETVKNVIDYMKSPKHSRESSAELIAGISKIVITGLAAVGTIALSEVVSKGLVTAFPPLAAGGIANMIGLLISGIGMSIISILIMKQIDKFIVNKLEEESSKKILEKQNEIVNLQKQQIAVVEQKGEIRKNKILNNIDNRHKEANKMTKDALDNIFAPVPEAEYDFEDIQADLNSLL
jgi:hypothetical protein